MKRKQLQYPDYNSFRRLRHNETIFKTRYTELRFFPKSVFVKPSICLYKIDGGVKDEVAFPATEDGYKAAIIQSNAWINERLDEIEQEFYEVDE